MIGIIPARYDSRRFPGKIATLIDGVAMVTRVFENLCASDVSGVVVATDYEPVAENLGFRGAEIVFTERPFENQISRCAHAVRELSITEDVLILHADEPFLTTRDINRCVHDYPGQGGFTLGYPLVRDEQMTDKNIVKAVLNPFGIVERFTRKDTRPFRVGHAGIYVLPASVLLDYDSTPETDTEDIALVRLLDAGLSMMLEPSLPFDHKSINTTGDLDGSS
jgi:3-deoxy-manno-octulosonate cytidylyltransferase (CMP-KDO synthetase)